eukprot:scaffold6916_cov143-Skeletonema_menzelii.AAC.4
MAAQIERDGARKMSGEDQMMFQDHVHPFVDKEAQELSLSYAILRLGRDSGNYCKLSAGYIVLALANVKKRSSNHSLSFHRRIHPNLPLHHHQLN